MKLSRFLLITALATQLCLLYVYQQTEIFRFGYQGQKRLSQFEDLLDKNTLLRYNIAQSASLVRLGDKVAASSEFQMPDTYRLVKLTHSLTGLKVAGSAPKKETILSGLFGIKSQAEAKTTE